MDSIIILKQNVLSN